MQYHLLKMDVRVGFHVSIAGAIANSIDNAKKIGCSAFQIFSRNPRGWSAKPLDEKDAIAFRDKLAASGINSNSVLVHMPYLPNLAGPNGELYKKSTEALIQEVQRCSLLGIRYLVIHLGSHRGEGTLNGITQVANACSMAIDEAGAGTATVQILLENSAGGKDSVGSKFEEIGLILDKLDSGRFGICLDTCHAFASGHDIRSKDGVDSMLEEFDNKIGLDKLEAVHLNDSKYPFKSNRDRHEHIGLGEIGMDGFAAILSNCSISKVPLIMETPIDARRGDSDNLRVILHLLAGDRYMKG
jgi:deoxyribonuclease-4